MIINNTPQNEAILSNVGEIGEFRIRNSAKAFNILSSGLYANKIKAIVRELSCNAVDSHAAAGKTDTPFDVHLPNQLEPWFSIRDYGTGLDHDQVTNIYTTYFESTKTNSNEFIGALGLGSKSPFSYTDNFTVTAIKDGVKGIYSAFINEQGVPSIAKMATEETSEPAGVEVKFSVNDRWDFDKFAQEAGSVYKWFKLRPVVTGNNYFEIRDIKHETENIIPGVHHTGGYNSTALMGNIAYPIDVPNPDTNLGNLHKLLRCGLTMEFGIGELDFQASREGLSYIPQTIESIKKKLEALNAKLAVYIADEANKLDNLWERAMFLQDKARADIWSGAVQKYIADTKFDMFDPNPHYVTMRDQKVKVDALEHLNISIRAFNKNRGYSTATNVNVSSEYHPTKLDKKGHRINIMFWRVPVSSGARFIINDTKVGASERARNHFRKMDHTRDLPSNFNVFVLEPVDKTKPMNIKALKKILKNPPEAYFMNASELMERERATSTGGMAKNVTIMKLEEKGYGGYRSYDDMVWRDAGKLDSFDTKATFYYIPLSGYNIDSEKFKGWSGKTVSEMLTQSGIPALHVNVYGVRKGDIKTVQAMKNWINVETLAEQEVKKLTDVELKTIAASMIDRAYLVQYKAEIIKHLAPTSPYAMLAEKNKNVVRVEVDRDSLRRLCEAFGVTVDLDKFITEINVENAEVLKRYPLLKQIGYADGEHVAEYITAIDLLKK
jgi:hypothetical protein